MYVSAQISDGLGNRFFQVAAMLWYAKRYGHRPMFAKAWIKENSHPGPHGIEFYFPDIPFLELEGTWSIFEPPFSLAHKYLELPANEGNVQLKGYFQAWQHVALPIPSVFQTIGFHIPNSFFLHVRRGDYLHPHCKHHVVDLTNYIRRAIVLMPLGATVIVCSDDISWCKSALPGLIGPRNFVFFEGDDYQTLAMMIHCDLGGICANSTFSWWGAYWGSLAHVDNTGAMPVYTMPDVWGYAPLPPADDLLAPWATVVATA